VRAALGAELLASGCDWRALLLRELTLEPLWEVWRGEDFLENRRGAAETPPALPPGHSAVLVHSLRRTSLGGFADAARASGARAGVVLAFRHDAADFEPFGIWLAWLCCGAELVVVDLQNSLAHASLAEAVAALGWDEPPRDEVFFAAMR